MVSLWYLYGIFMVFIWYLYGIYFGGKEEKQRSTNKFVNFLIKLFVCFEEIA